MDTNNSARKAWERQKQVKGVNGGKRGDINNTYNNKDKLNISKSRMAWLQSGSVLSTWGLPDNSKCFAGADSLHLHSNKGCLFSQIFE